MSKKTGIKAKSVPTKTTLNLVIKEKSEFRPGRLVPAVLIVLIAAGIFCKFAVLNRFAALDADEKQLAEEQQQLNNLILGYKDYDEVEAEYNRYTYKDFDRTIPDHQDVLNVIEKHVFPVSGTRQMAITGKSVSLTLTGMTLEEISSLIAKLEAEPLVDSVTVSTAGYTEANKTVPVANMVIILSDATTLEGGGNDE